MISTNLHLWPFVAEAQRRGAKVVGIDPLRHRGEQSVTVHPHDAAERGATDGQCVRVFNDRSQFAALTRINDDIARGVLMVPMGAWPKNAKDHSTVNAVTPFAFAGLGNAPTFSDTRVEIEPM
ncbi:MAG: molybdopterin dinucleotide binding domain-containing protein [Streptosporangiaceae bacterium]